jgi:hypothetical protein
MASAPAKRPSLTPPSAPCRSAPPIRSVRAAAQQPAGVRVEPSARPLTMVLPPVTMVLPPVTMDLGLLLVSIGVVNLWRSRTGA